MVQLKPQVKPKWNEDKIILIIILIIIVISVYIKINEPAEAQAVKITGLILDDHSISFASGGLVDEDKLKMIQNMDYYEFKESLNIKNDFCIYIEDEKGNILLAKGSQKLNEDGLYCRE
ncbi:hypothetical protein HYW99_02665 [Candidatus Woesearchaeota archaeon]|nr:hypothetical protein [Candidatus Woesearchaeota archaeon]